MKKIYLPLALFFLTAIFPLPRNFSHFLYAEPSELDYGYPENNPLYFGNPSDARADSQEEWNFLMEKSQFTESYNKGLLIPNWVAWHLAKDDLGDSDRSNKFAPDKTLPQGWYAVKKADYQYTAYGFDRGHVCPSADRTSSKEANEETFLMTNMLPQAPDCNRIVWKDLEEYERDLVNQGMELYIFAGGFGRGGIGNNGYFEEILLEENSASELYSSSDSPTVVQSDLQANPLLDKTSAPQSDLPTSRLAIAVPEFCWKIILALPEGDDDLARVTGDCQVIAVCIPNKQGCQEGGSWELYECSVDYIEEITQMDFFELLPDEIEAELEK